MTTKSETRVDYFNNDGYLSDESAALYVDALKLEKTDAPSEIGVELEGFEQS